MIVVTSALALTLQQQGTADYPAIGWQNLVAAGAITAGSEQANYPASNLANPATDPTQSWKSDSAATQNIDFTISQATPIDYVAIARHNLGSGEIQITVRHEDANNLGSFVDLYSNVQLANDDVAIFRFSEIGTPRIRLTLAPQGSVKPQIAVVYIGKLLVMQRGIYVGHTPLTLGRRHEVNAGRNGRGDFLGRIVTSKSRNTVASIKNLKPDWYRSVFDLFAKAAVESPFFFAWRPQSYPSEVGYCWLSEDPRPSNSLPNGMMQVDIPVEGIAE